VAVWVFPRIFMGSGFMRSSFWVGRRCGDFFPSNERSGAPLTERFRIFFLLDTWTPLPPAVCTVRSLLVFWKRVFFSFVSLPNDSLLVSPTPPRRSSCFWPQVVSPPSPVSSFSKDRLTLSNPAGWSHVYLLHVSAPRQSVPAFFPLALFSTFRFTHFSFFLRFSSVWDGRDFLYF